jgi:hypothetical protein
MIEVEALEARSLLSVSPGAVDLDMHSVIRHEKHEFEHHTERHFIGSEVFDFVWEPLYDETGGGDPDHDDNHGSGCCCSHCQMSQRLDSLLDPNLDASWGSLGGGVQTLATAEPFALEFELASDEILFSLDSIPVLNSLPGASISLFLDFNGHFQSSWGAYSNATTPVYDVDGDFTTFSSLELANMQMIWEIVAEDFATFNINVTTVEPAVLATGVPISAANGQALRVAIGGSWQDWYGSSAGGVGYIDNFTNSIANVVYVFRESGGARQMGETAAHEAGHGFGLRHQSTYDELGVNIDEYEDGGKGWEPVMGGAPTTQTASIWHYGTNSQGSNVYQDDLAVLTKPANGITYRTDDHGNSVATATPLATTGTTWLGAGIIEHNTDVDVFSLTTSGQAIRLDVNVASLAPNLNVVLELRNASNEVVASADPADSLSASIIGTFPAGNYTLHVTKVNTYGWIGTYTINGISVAPGPFISSSSLEGFIAESSLEHVRVTFDQPIDPTTFDPADVRLDGPSGPVAITSVTAVGGSNNRQFDIAFPLQTTLGLFDLTVGVDATDPIRDSAGNPMNQDADLIAGEIGEDQFRRRFSLIAPGWAFPITSVANVHNSGIALGPDGSVYVQGQFSGTADFDPSPAIHRVTTQGNFDGFIAKYTGAQELLWVKTFGGADGSEYSRMMEVDDVGNVYVAGYFSSAVAAFGPLSVTSGGSSDAYVAKLDTNGNFLWVRSWGSTEFDDVEGMTLAANGDLHITGGYRGTVDFNPGAGTYLLTSQGAQDGYLLTLDANGNFKSALSIGGTGTDNVSRVASDSAGNVYLSAEFQATAQFGTSDGSTPITLASAGATQGDCAMLGNLRQ